MKNRVSILLLFISAGMSQTATALERTRLGLVEEGEFSFLTGLDYQQGDYGSPDSTSLWRIPFSLTYRKKNFGVFASMPLLAATSDGDIIITNRPTMHAMGSGSTTVKTGDKRVSGIGDIELSGSYYFTPDLRDEMTYRLTGVVKFGTADENKGLGTGENDFSLEGGIIKNIDEYILAGTLGYEINGSPPGFDFDDVFYGQLGLTKQLAKNRKIGTSLYYSQIVSGTTEAPLEVSFFYRQPALQDRDVYFYLAKGLSNGSPDFSLGGRIQFYY